MKERDAKLGDIIETHNGNRYLMCERGQIYVGNADPDRVESDNWIPVRLDSRCKIVGRVVWNEVPNS